MIALPHRFGAYELTELVGAGSTANVYRAQRNGDEVAVKVFRLEATEGPDFRDRFRREAMVFSALDHPNIVRMLDWGVNEPTCYLVFEFVRGKLLRDKMGADRPPAPQALRLLAQIFEGMGYAHEKGIVHRDLRPSKLLVTDSGWLKILDFGLTRLQNSTLTPPGTAIGTPVYAAPEQLQAEKVDGRADQYALGVITYELLAGRLPWTEQGYRALLNRKLEGEPDPPGDGVSPAVAAVIAQMLAKDPQARYPDLASALMALRIAANS
ncbi:MAG: serine/threonine protein kinase [Armatimonadetes bacterium]|nr:serine/threonine protein kinase [Armatimonadota bacterium]